MGMMSGDLEQELEALLAEGVDGARKREAAAFDELIGSDARELVLFGAGNLGRRTLGGLRKIGIEPLCFVDNDKVLRGKDRNGLKVISPEEGARLYGDRATFVVTIWYGEGTDRMPARVAQLRRLGCKSVVPFLPLYWKFPDTFLPHYCHDLPSRAHLEADRIRQGFRLMTDENSRREYIAQMRFRLLGDFDSLPAPVPGTIYFRDDMFRLGSMETLVDCGAFDGDTISLFLEKTGNMFKGAFGFEPDPANYARLVERVSLMPAEIRRRITLHQAATGEVNERVLMDVGNGPASQIGKGDFEVECYALDPLLQDVPVTFIKMDIEGSEFSTLVGARELIRANAPILTICVYHKQSHLWDVPIFLNDLNSEYSFHLLPHLLEGWDLVCYAVPSNRHI